MLKLTKFLISQIVDHPDQITIDQTTDDTDTVIITITVAQDDMGKVIGKGGKIISAIREIVKVKAIKQGLRVRVILKDPTQTDSLSQSDSPEPQPDKSQTPPTG